jgi:N-formylglutamate deformylase
MSSLIRFLPGSAPLVLDSPHSGVAYPADFRHDCELATLRQAEDTHVEKLYDFAPELGVAWIEALFPRSYIDVNRNTTEVDVTLLEDDWSDAVETDPAAMNKVRLGKGLIWRMTDDGLPIYKRKLNAAEVRNRIDSCWRPYHQAVEQAINDAHARHGYSIHLNCHSMPAIASAYSTDFPGLAHADFVIGDRDGSTAHPALSHALCDILRGFGYEVSYNHPYKGVELVRRYGKPSEQRHGIQVEVNRRLYMDEATLELNPHFLTLRGHLRQMVDQLLAIDPRRIR